MTERYRPSKELVELVNRTRVIIREVVTNAQVFSGNVVQFNLPGLPGMVVVDRLFQDPLFLAIRERPLALLEAAADVGHAVAPRFHERLSGGAILDAALIDELVIDIFDLVPPFELGDTIRWVTEVRPRQVNDVILNARSKPPQPRVVRELIASEGAGFRTALRERLGL